MPRQMPMHGSPSRERVAEVGPARRQPLGRLQRLRRREAPATAAEEGRARPSLPRSPPRTGHGLEERMQIAGAIVEDAHSHSWTSWSAARHCSSSSQGPTPIRMASPIPGRARNARTAMPRSRSAAATRRGIGDRQQDEVGAGGERRSPRARSASHNRSRLSARLACVAAIHSRSCRSATGPLVPPRVQVNGPRPPGADRSVRRSQPHIRCGVRREPQAFENVRSTISRSDRTASAPNRLRRRIQHRRNRGSRSPAHLEIKALIDAAGITPPVGLLGEQRYATAGPARPAAFPPRKTWSRSNSPEEHRARDERRRLARA